MHFLLERALSLMSCSAGDGIPEPVTANIHDAINAEGSPLLVGRDNRATLARRGKLILAALYAVQVFYSFFIM
jgi:copper transporter 1